MLAIIDIARAALEKVLAQPDVVVDSRLIDSVSKLASAHSNLSRESLRWSERLRKSAACASLQDRVRGATAFLASLPLGERQKAYAVLVESELQQPTGLKLRLD